jgi:phage shock protein E
MKDFTTIALVVGVLLVFFAVKAAAQTAPTEAKALVDAGALLVDVRTPDEFKAGHIEGAKNIPVSEVAHRVDEFGPKDGVVVVYCRSGGRSGQAKKTLDAAGFTAVHNGGGMSAWVKANGK